MNSSLNQVELLALSPFLVLLTGALIVLLVETFWEKASRQISFYLTLLTIACAGVAVILSPESHHQLLTPWLRFDTIARSFNTLFLGIGFGSVLLSDPFFKRFGATKGEFYFLLLSSLFGLLLIGSSADFLTLFLGLETLSISLYVLCGYMKTWNVSHESSIKYFLIGSIAAAFLLYGFALIYGAVGTTRLDALMAGYKGLQGSKQVLFMAGTALITLGLCFKAAIVPFHMWAPDVYDGAPTPVTGFMAVGTKAGAFAAFAIIFLVSLPQFNLEWNRLISYLAFPTLIYANYVAIKQEQLRRFFAYSGISHAGFLLIPIAVGTSQALPALLFYLIVYAFATLGAFGVISYLDTRPNGVLLKDLHGLFKKSPFLATVLAICLLTLAGIPPSIGFFAKLYLFKLAFQAGYYALIVVALLTTVLSAYYYLRIVVIMMTDKPTETVEKPELLHSPPALALVVICCISLLALSIYPQPILNLLSTMP